MIDDVSCSGHLCKFIVNTVNAGSGALAVTIDGPSKVQLSCREIEEGYEFTYSPTAPGDYLITIKYAGSTHIPGSPFKAQIEGKSCSQSLSLDKAVASRAVFVIVSGSDGRAETLLEPAK